jgi:hypothetical protein
MAAKEYFGYTAMFAKKLDLIVLLPWSLDRQ